MEKTLKEKAKQGELQQHKIALPSYNKPSVSSAKLAGIAISLRLRLRAANMPVNMQEHALSFTRSLLDSNTTKPSQLACSLKKEFDSVYGPAWHCIVGKSFGSFVTHSDGGFIYFSNDSLSFLLFKTEVLPVTNSKS